MDEQICVECGRYTKPGSGLFVNRVPVMDSPETNREMGRHFPEGSYKCRECEHVSEMFGRLNNPDEKGMDTVVAEIEAEIKDYPETGYVKELKEELKSWRSK